MKRQSARQKGKDFEARVGEVLGNWWQGAPFPRAHGSGSSATLSLKENLTEAGDLYTSVNFPWSVECKNEQAWSFISLLSGRCKIFWDWWYQSCRSARRVGRRPMLVFKRNRYPTFLAIRASDPVLESNEFCGIYSIICCNDGGRLFVCSLDSFVELGV